MKPILIIAAFFKNLDPFVDLGGSSSPAVVLATWKEVFISGQKAGVFLG